MPAEAPEITILYDGDCPLCVREARVMRRLDKGRGRLGLENIAAPEFEPERYGLTFEQAMGAMHGVLPDGSLVKGLEAFQRAYAAVGRGWVMSWTALPIIKPIADAAYRWFARNRHRLTGRAEACDTDRCRT